MTTQTQSQPPPNPALAYEANLVPAMFRPWTPELLNRASPQAGDRVLDVACGTGIVARQATPVVGAEGSVVGLDISPPMLEVAASLPEPEGAPISWEQGSADELPFPDSSFDLVLCQQGLQFVPDKPAAVREMHRVLNPGGRAGVSVWRGLDHQPVFAALDDAIDRHLGYSAGDPFSLGDAGELRSLFDDAGFDDTHLEAVSRNVHFPSAEGFVRIIVMSAAAVIPEFAELDDETKDSMIGTVGTDVEGRLQPYRDNGGLTFPMESHIVVAKR